MICQYTYAAAHIARCACRWTVQGESYCGSAQPCDMCPAVQNDVKKAKAILKEALKSPAALKANVAAMVALANILFQQKQFSEAHRYYCQVTS